MTHLLFICSQNRLRSPTAEQVFAHWPGMATASADINHGAVTPLSAELLEWADLVFVMEPIHRRKVSSKFRTQLGNTKLICLGSPDDYAFMDPDLIELLKARRDASSRPTRICPFRAMHSAQVQRQRVMTATHAYQ